MIVIFLQEEEEEVLENSVDHVLMVGCKHEIKTHCQEHSEPNGIFNCLKVKNNLFSFAHQQ